MKIVRVIQAFALSLAWLPPAGCSANTSTVSTGPTTIQQSEPTASASLKNREATQQTSNTTLAGPPSEDAARDAIETRKPLSVPGVPAGVLKTGMDYADLRRVVIALGWTPLLDKQCETNVSSDNLCSQMPELSECSVDGYCLMHFHLTSTNQDMEVCTYGDTTGWDANAKGSQLAVTGLAVALATSR